MLDEKNYPMTYKEYEKRVIELLLEDCDERFRDLMMEKVEAELKKEPNFIQMSYGYDCFILKFMETSLRKLLKTSF